MNLNKLIKEVNQLNIYKNKVKKLLKKVKKI